MTQRQAARHLSRRTVARPRSVEAYIQAGLTPRFIERALQIENQIRRQRARAERAYEWMRVKYAGDPDAFAQRWRAMAHNWRFGDVNELIAQHNEWYPVERRLPLNPRTGDYVTAGGRDWRRRPLDARWILDQFPVVAPLEPSSRVEKRSALGRTRG